ncbi:alpha/beta hydrolase [Nocardioides sp. YIM 152315]|uniref:alpha/beta hydrolase n=1 Tax=Nocardioides sp. YIM 152315 TaxID=3031760 RepID=UPI0023DAFCD9|nr:alpha/beta hydrolase [Nocardioides sp. YIM 152315]MDF1605010.1 alpha/beta hydrolase [Nocardioides sp. YIM 152315]
MSILERVERLALRGAMALPAPLQRLLAGRPVVRDGEALAVDTQLMLRMQRVVREPGAETLPIADGRLAVLRHTRLAAGDQPIGSVRELTVAGLPARLYTPSLDRGSLLVFFHGGGFMYGDLDSHDAACRFLAERSGVRVLAVDYRLGPEQPFPAAYDDAIAAYRWVVEHADDLAVERDRIAVGGDSAGGNLAAVVAVEAARSGLPLAFQLLVYPATDAVRETASARLFADGFYLTRAFMDLANASYIGDHDLRDPRVSPAYVDLPAGLAPAYVATAGFDPLRDEGEAYARRLEAAGVPVELRRFADQIHGFFNVVGIGRTARAANAEIAAALRAGLSR